MALEFACHRVGVTDCKHVATAGSKEELVEQVAKHAKEVHGVELNDTLVDYALTTVRET